MTLALELREIHKRFGEVVALDGASLAVRPGTVHALLGENGAGKTTLMRVAFGLVAPDAGEVRVGGESRRWRNAAAALAGGVGMVHQHFTLVPAMTVAENVSLGGRGPFRPAEAAARVRSLAAATGLDTDPDALVRELPVGAQQRVEILKAVARDVRVLILDEPTAVLAPPEVEGLLRWMRGFVARGDRAIVLITHKLREATQVADEVTVLRAGQTVLSGTGADTPRDDVVRAMLGSGWEPPDGTGIDAMPATTGPEVLRLHGVAVREPHGRTLLHPTTVSVRRGEVVGVAAVEGSGQHALLRLLAARLEPSEGRAEVPSDVAFVPEDRLRDGAVPGFTLTENLALRGLDSARTLPWDDIEGHARAVITQFDVRAPSASTPFRALSGGNQQKFVLGRELTPLPPAIVAENPTRGLDVRAADAVLGGLRRAAAAGAAVVVHSADLDEVLAIADRVWVVHAGVVREVARDRAAVGAAMLGSS